MKIERMKEHWAAVHLPYFDLMFSAGPWDKTQEKKCGFNQLCYPPVENKKEDTCYIRSKGLCLPPEGPP